MKNLIYFRSLNLQLFAEGGAGAGDGGTGASGATGATATAAVSQTKGAKSNPLADVKYGVQKQETAAESPAAEVEKDTTEDRSAKYEAFIKEHKDLDDARIQSIVKNRLKNSKETEEKLSSISPILDMLSKKYGVDASDIKALNKAIEDDDSYYEQEAMEKGITVEQLKEIRKMERENADLKRQMQEQSRRENAAKQYAAWMEQAERAKAVYPSLNLENELKNPKFVDLLRSNVDVETAFKAIHMDEILPAAMQYTAKTVEEKVANNIKAMGSRPTENGNSSQSAAVVKSDVSTLTKADRDEINRRVMRGEKISFS